MNNQQQNKEKLLKNELENMKKAVDSTEEKVKSLENAMLMMEEGYAKEVLSHDLQMKKLVLSGYFENIEGIKDKLKYM
ncbi:hypothetical protein [Bacillus solimangrovi]|uniref:Uncharacterized protein n=1 Tax=Bacillus solimangrovi TaxID=1305675 RepID=A0A1E5LJ12_9BACI|nr:hypothetical protein [Bacillus solimangrovi]OEH94083.1 hypothetical protein BFG57_09560 [Bacillus solimangrovi]